MAKPWLDYAQQVELLASRGMEIADIDQAAGFLSKVGYYRFSGYFRYWQTDPLHGNNSFRAGTVFDTIRNLYEAEQGLATVCDDILHPLEILLRTRFAHYYGKLVGEQGCFVTGEGFTPAPNLNDKRIEDYILYNLNRSRENSIAHYRSEAADMPYGAEAYSQMPIWVAVEVLPLGTLSRMIAASQESGVLAAMADSMNTSPARLPSQVRSFVYLRNRIAHCSRLWNHSVLDVPGLLPKTERRIKRDRKFTNHSVYKVFAAMSDVATRAGLQGETTDWLNARVNPILDANALLAAGICEPRKYGQFTEELARLAPHEPGKTVPNGEETGSSCTI